MGTPAGEPSVRGWDAGAETPVEGVDRSEGLMNSRTIRAQGETEYNLATRWEEVIASQRVASGSGAAD
jgi:hypothetical protein